MRTVLEDEPLLTATAASVEYISGDGPSNLRDNPESHNLRDIPRDSTGAIVSSLDFERIVNQYSIQAVRDQWLLPPLPADGSTSKGGSRRRGVPPRHSIDTTNRLKRQRRTLLGYTGRTATRWFLSILAGLLTGLTSNLIVNVSEIAVGWRSRRIQSLIINQAYTDRHVLSIIATFTTSLALASCLLCVCWAPQAAGSGVSAVKAYLNGIRGSQKFTRLPLFVVKVVGTILSVSSGLAVGQEGPLIHIGAIMGSGCSKISQATSMVLQKLQSMTPPCCRQQGVEKWVTWTNTELSHFATDAERRDLICIGASCGFAASFGAPVGGLLFILDDISSYFSKSLLLRMLVANAIGTFCLAVQHGDLSNYSVINLGHYKELTNSIYVNRVEEIPLYVIMGLFGGVLGGGFCKTCMWLSKNIGGRFPPRGQGRVKWQLLEVAVVSLLTSLVLFYLPSMNWACKPIVDPSQLSYGYETSALKTEFDSSSRNRFFCPEGEINELANIIFGSRIDAIKRILTDPAQFKLETLLGVGSVFYFLMTITFGISIPSGTFTPTVLIGASLGGAAGLFFQNHLDPEITPATFALLGVAGLLAGIQRSTVSVAVILVEGTGQITVLTPAIIVVVIARYVAGLIYKDGIFEAVMRTNKLAYLDHEEAKKRRYDAIEVGDILSDCPLETLYPREKAGKIAALLERSLHHGFPVVDPKSKKFLGLVRRDQLCALLECGVFDTSAGDESSYGWTRPESGLHKAPLMRWAYHINDDRYDYILHAERKQPPARTIEKAPRFSMISSKKLHLASYSALPTEFASIAENKEGCIFVAWLNPDYEQQWVNVGAVMNRGAYCVQEFCPVSKAYSLFTRMGLRHLVVVGGESGGEVVGVLSRANLLPSYINDKTGV